MGVEKILKELAIEKVGSMARVDVGREVRRGIPEVILATGKTPKLAAKIALRVAKKAGRAMVSRVSDGHIRAIKAIIPERMNVKINKKAGVVVLKDTAFKVEKTGGKVGIITAGTSDIPVAEEARAMAEEMGCEVFTAYDVGVAGIHRLFRPLRRMIKKDVDVLIVVAGMEGALPSVVAGMVDLPVIGVPTSTSFGFGEKGISALMAMLQGCPLGLAVVNIDNGIGAGAIATLIANRVASKLPVPRTSP